MHPYIAALVAGIGRFSRQQDEHLVIYSHKGVMWRKNRHITGLVGRISVECR